jgi:hypothetical protein
MFLEFSSQNFSIMKKIIVVGTTPWLANQLERLVWRCRAMTCSPVNGRKLVDILQDFRLWINFLRVYGIS